jgi:hypothetical protein
MLMVTTYVADGLRAPLMSVEMFAEAFQQILMKETYVVFNLSIVYPLLITEPSYILFSVKYKALGHI